ncbi:MAG: hypothetical protein K2X07_12840 [Caulobacteraceae bacterium]|nr:hypothetical protein [Caulobacteraceae bacterium]
MAAARNIPVISRVLQDGTLVETVYDVLKSSTSLAIRSPDGSVRIADSFDLPSGGRLTPYSAANNLLVTGCVLLPSKVGDFKDLGDKEDLVRDVRAFLHRYVDLSPGFEEIAAHYVLLTWVHDAFNELGYLRFRGDYGTGKTRALLAVGSLCYKPFFASGASTVSPIFHVLDAVGGTLVLDEADLRFSDATADLTKILNNGTVRGLPVLRTMANRHRELNPQAFRVFGPKLIAMRHRFADDALESRFLTEETGTRPLRSDIPIHLPEALHAEARELRNRLLAWRFHAFGQVGPDPSRLVPGIEPRRNQTALALLSLVDDPETRRRIAGELVGEEARVLQERAASPEATMLASLATAFRQGSGAVSVSEVAQGFNQSLDKDDAPKSAKWTGWFLRTKLRLRTERVRGVYVVPRSQIGAIRTLARRYGVDVGGADAQDSAVGSAREARPLAPDARNAPVEKA